MIREPGKLGVNFHNSDMPKFGIRDERNNKLQEYFNRRESSLLEKSTKTKMPGIL